MMAAAEGCRTIHLLFSFSTAMKNVLLIG